MLSGSGFASSGELRSAQPGSQGSPERHLVRRVGPQVSEDSYLPALALFFSRTTIPDSSAILHASNLLLSSSYTRKENNSICNLTGLEHNDLPQSRHYTPVNAAYSCAGFLAGTLHNWLILSLCSTKSSGSFLHKRLSFGK